MAKGDKLLFKIGGMYSTSFLLDYYIGKEFEVLVEASGIEPES